MPLGWHCHLVATFPATVGTTFLILSTFRSGWFASCSVVSPKTSDFPQFSISCFQVFFPEMVDGKIMENLYNWWLKPGFTIDFPIKPTQWILGPVLANMLRESRISFWNLSTCTKASCSVLEAVWLWDEGLRPSWTTLNNIPKTNPISRDVRPNSYVPSFSLVFGKSVIYRLWVGSTGWLVKLTA